MRSFFPRLVILAIALGTLSACTITPARVALHPPVQVYSPPVMVVEPAPYVVIAPRMHSRIVVREISPPRHKYRDRYRDHGRDGRRHR